MFTSQKNNREGLEGNAKSSRLLFLAPNWSEIREALEIGDLRILKIYFDHLEDAELIKSISKATEKFSQLEAQSKVYLNNPNLLFAISTHEPSKRDFARNIFS